MSRQAKRSSLIRRALVLAVPFLLILLSAGPAPAATQAQFASSWAVNNNADWTPFPPNPNPLGPPNDLCTGSSTPTGDWADFSFPAFTIPGGEIVNGIELRVRYLSQSGSNTAQLKSGGSLVGATRTVPQAVGTSSCDHSIWVSAGGMGDLWGTSLATADFNAGTVSVRFTQNANTVDIDAVEMVVHYGPVNSPPTAEAGGPYNVPEGGSVMLDGSGSSDPDEPAAGLTYEWDLDGDAVFGEAGETGATPTFSAAGLDGPTSRVVTLRVTDAGALAATDTATVNVTNVAPTVAAPTVAPEPSDEGQAATASATFTDPGLPDTFTCTVDYGEGDGPVAGTVAASTCTGPAHVYDDDGTYTVTIAVSDDDGGNGVNSASHEVENVPPAVAAPTVTPEPSDEGQAATASAAFTDAGANDGPFTCTVDYGDGSGPVGGTVAGSTCTGATHTYADDGLYTVEVAVTDKDGGTGTASAGHQVDNVAPSITATTNSGEACGDTPEGGVVEVSAEFTDPGFDSPGAGTMEDFTDSTIDWGDGTVDPATVAETPGSAGTPTTGTVSGSHVYAGGGIFTVTITVADDDGGTDTATLTLYVTGAGVNGGELQVVGTELKDVVNLQVKKSAVEVHAGFLGTPGKAAFPVAAVTALRVAVCGGDDQVHVNRDVTVPAVLEGGAGRDHLRAGSGPTVLDGGGDDDNLQGGPAADVLLGGDGDDALFGRGGDDLLDGGPGDDQLHGNHGDDGLDGGPGIDLCRGEPGADTIVGCEL
jgi:hypothetical protein